MSELPRKIDLRHLAHTRSGDKGDTSNIAVIAWTDELYPLLKSQLTASAVADHFDGVIKGQVVRHDVDRLGVLNFVADGALGGGVSRSLSLDQYGKTLAAALLNFQIEVPQNLHAQLVNHPGNIQT